jgi:hypothetical protein
VEVDRVIDVMREVADRLRERSIPDRTNQAGA